MKGTNLRKNTSFRYGYVPSFYKKIVRLFAKGFVNFFALNSNTIISTEICQLIDPVSQVDFHGHKLYFKSGHGRLRWRAQTFHSEEPLMIKWLKSFKSDDIFLDVGANVGTYSIPAAKIANKVIAIELDPANIYCLHTNIFINKLQDKVLTIPIASGSSKDVQDIFYRDFSIGDALQSVGRDQVLPTNRPNPFKISQLIYPIDDIFKDFKLPQPTKVKIDVDGNESIVTKGAWNVLSKAEEIYFEDNGMEEDLYIINNLKEKGFEIKDEMPSIVGSVKSDIARNLIMKRITSN